MQTKKLIWAQIAYKSNKLTHNYSQTKTHKSLYNYGAFSNERWKDKVANLCEHLDWMGWLKSWQICGQIEDELEQGKKTQERKGKTESLGSGWTKQYI